MPFCESSFNILGLNSHLFTVHIVTFTLLKKPSTKARPDNTQTATPDTHTNRGHTATYPKHTNNEAGG
jgi:hypothetical protein